MRATRKKVAFSTQKKSKHISLGAEHRNAVSIPTVAGVFLAEISKRGLAQLHFPPSKQSVVGRSTKLSPAEARLAKRLAGQLNDYFRGRFSRFAVPLDIRCGTEFQRRVWRKMARIPVYQTRTYGQLASAIGKPKAVRAVGGACGANPIPIIIPCHRVVAANGSLGGFSAGLHWKRRLLALEQGTPQRG